MAEQVKLLGPDLLRAGPSPFVKSLRILLLDPHSDGYTRCAQNTCLHAKGKMADAQSGKAAPLPAKVNASVSKQLFRLLKQQGVCAP